MSILNQIGTYKDQRGKLLTLFNEGQWKEVNYIETKKNVMRGNHYHKKLQEMVFILSGTVTVTIEDIHKKEKRTHVLRKENILMIKPYELHTFYTQTASKWLNFLSLPFDPDNPDVYRYEKTEC